jgi:hypothetical protein
VRGGLPRPRHAHSLCKTPAGHIGRHIIAA